MATKPAVKTAKKKTKRRQKRNDNLVPLLLVLGAAAALVGSGNNNPPPPPGGTDVIGLPLIQGQIGPLSLTVPAGTPIEVRWDATNGGGAAGATDVVQMQVQVAPINSGLIGVTGSPVTILPGETLTLVVGIGTSLNPIQLPRTFTLTVTVRDGTQAVIGQFVFVATIV